MTNLQEEIKQVIGYEPTVEELKAADETNAIVVLSQGVLADGDYYYAYVAIEPSKFMAFKEAELKGNYKFSDYGKIIKFERKAAPTKEVMEEMEKALGLDHNFEEKMMKAYKEAKGEA